MTQSPSELPIADNSESGLPSSNNSESPLGKKRKFQFWRCFWLTFLVVSLAYAWYCFYVPANNIVWADNFASAQKQAAESGKPMILHFTGKWCVPCKIMKRQVWADKEMEKRVNSQFTPVAIDIDNPEDAEVLTRYNVTGSPVTILTDPQGNALRWQAGGMSKSEFLNLLRGPNPSATNEL